MRRRGTRPARTRARPPAIDQRAVMVLHYYLDLPLTEVAEILDIPVGTAKSRLHRGLEALRASMRVEPEAVDRPWSRSGRHERVDRSFERWVAARSPTRAPRRPPDRASTTTSSPRRAGMRPSPRWLALIKEPPMRISSRVAVGSPTARLAAILAATAAPRRLGAGAVVAGASYLAGHRPAHRRPERHRAPTRRSPRPSSAAEDGDTDPGPTGHVPRVGHRSTRTSRSAVMGRARRSSSRSSGRTAPSRPSSDRWPSDLMHRGQ